MKCNLSSWMCKKQGEKDSDEANRDARAAALTAKNAEATRGNKSRV